LLDFLAKECGELVEGIHAGLDEDSEGAGCGRTGFDELASVVYPRSLMKFIFWQARRAPPPPPGKSRG
jgi:hypothetical protein